MFSFIFTNKQIILLGLVLSLFCTTSAFSDTEKLKPINLGVIVPLTGPLAFFGQDFVRTFDLAVQDIPDLKSRINIYWEDSAYNSRQAISALDKLISVNQVDIVLSFGGPMLNALAPIAEAKQIPFFATESEKNDCEGRKFCSLFRNEQDEWGKATWIILRKEGKKKVGIVKNQNQFMDTFVNAIIKNKAPNEIVDIAIDVSPETVDLRTNILGLAQKDYDAVGVYLLPGTHHGFLQALRGAKKSFNLFGLEEFLVKEHNKGFENITDNALVIAPSATNGYREKFEKKYGPSPGFFYTPAFYDFIALLNDVIKSHPNARRIELVNAMRFSGYREGASGKYSVKVSDKGVHSYSFPIAIYQVNKGHVAVKEIINF